MGRRYKRRARITSVVGDVAHIASRISWWGALLAGLAAYVLISILLGGFIESRAAVLEGNMFQAAVDVRLGQFARVCNWVGIACFITGVFFAIRNYFYGCRAQDGERILVAFFAKLLGRNLD